MAVPQGLWGILISVYVPAFGPKSGLCSCFAPVSYASVPICGAYSTYHGQNYLSMAGCHPWCFSAAYMMLSMLMVAAYIHAHSLSGIADPSYTLPQEELENFPLPTVQHSQTVLNQLRYPSVLLLVCQDSDQSKPDIHFFHCDEVEVRQADSRGDGGRRCQIAKLA